MIQYTTIFSFMSCENSVQWEPDIVLGYSGDKTGSYYPQRLLGKTPMGNTGARCLTNPGFLGNGVFVSWSWLGGELGINVPGGRNCTHKVGRVTKSTVSAMTCHQMMPLVPIGC